MPSKRWQKDLASLNEDAVEYEDVDAETIKDNSSTVAEVHEQEQKIIIIIIILQ